MKNISIKELSKTISVPEGTIRAWTLKPILGEVYTVGKVNYKNLQAGLRKYFSDKEFETKFGFGINEIEIIKSVKSASKEYVDIIDLEIGQEYDIHNYSMVSRWTLGNLCQINDNDVYIFFNKEGKYKAMSTDDLTEKNIKVEKVEEEE